MITDAVRSSLRELGITPSNYRVLAVLPLIYVAQADGTVEPSELDRVRKIAHDDLMLNKKEMEQFEWWMRNPPTKEYMRKAILLLRQLATTLGDGVEDLPNLSNIMSFAEEVGRSSGKVLDSPWSVDDTEREALQELRSVFGISDHTSWAELLEELG